MRIVRRAYARYPTGHRLHILIRFLTCPFPRVIDDVPVGARVLEIGSGHALFARLLVEERASEVVAVDPDLRKSLLPSPSPRIRKIAGYDDCLRGTFDAVVMVDVAYRLSIDAQRSLLARAFALLGPGGTFLCKEMDPSRRLKMTWTRVQEWLNEKLLGITLGTGVVVQTGEEMQAMLRDLGFAGVHARPIDKGYLHPHMLYTATKPL